MLNEEEAVDRARAMLQVRKAECRVLDRYRLYWRGKQALPVAPTGVPTEVKSMAKMSRINLVGLVVAVHAQGLNVVGYRNKGSGENASPWETWQANKMDARQGGVHRAALGYGAAYTIVLPGDPVPVIRGRSPRQLTAVYGEDPDWPEWALECGKSLGAWWWRLYDDEAVYHFAQTEGSMKKSDPELVLSSAEQHDLGVCPVVRFLNVMEVDDDDEVQSEIEALIPLQDQLDFTTFDLLVSQHFTAFKQRYVLGWLGKSEEERMKASASRFMTFEDGKDQISVGQFDESDLSGYLESRQATMHLAGMISQTAPSDLVAEMANLSADAIAAASRGEGRKRIDRETTFGESWEQTLELTATANGEKADPSAQVRWEDTEARSFAATVDGLGKLATMLHVPEEMLWEKIPGWTDTDIQRAKDLRKQAVSFGDLATLLDKQTAAPPAA